MDDTKIVLHNYTKHDVKLRIYRLLKDAADRDGGKKRGRS